VLDEFAGDKILEIEAAALMPSGRLLRHRLPPWLHSWGVMLSQHLPHLLTTANEQMVLAASPEMTAKPA
jgi:hypothetical protein